MKKLVITMILFSLAVCIYADIINLLPKTFDDRLDIIDPRIEETKKRTETDSVYATMFYFMGADTEFYVGSLYAENNTLNLVYYPPGQEGAFKDGSCIMAYNVKNDKIELIIKRWECYYSDEESDLIEKDIVYYLVLLFEKEGKPGYNCAYTTPDLDLKNYTINTAVVADKNVYAYSSPSFRSEKITELQEGTAIKVLPTILAENGPEEEPYDFWYKIELNGKQAWVYGYSIEFSKSFNLRSAAPLPARNNPRDSTITRINIPINSNEYYIVRYKDFKPDDVPQEIFDRLFEIQMEVVNNFTYDYAVLNGRKRYQDMYTKEDFYKYGMGVCENYANFFIILARENGLTKNLYKVSGNRRGGGHAWLEYRTENNVYIIDPTWSDDYVYTGGKAKQLFRESRAYGRGAFFITYPESRLIFTSSRNHNTYTGKTYVSLDE